MFGLLSDLNTWLANSEEGVRHGAGCTVYLAGNSGVRGRAWCTTYCFDLNKMVGFSFCSVPFLSFARLDLNTGLAFPGEEDSHGAGCAQRILDHFLPPTSVSLLILTQTSDR